MKKFLVGCAVVSLVGSVLVAGGVYFAGKWVSSQLPDVDRLEEYERQLVEAHGELGAWVPPRDLVYDAARLELFLEVRDSLLPRGRRVVTGWDGVVEEGEKGRLRGLLRGARQTMSILGESLRLIAVADSTLLEVGMGRGEYAHYAALLLYGHFRIDHEVLLEPLRDETTESERFERMQKLSRELREELQDVVLAHFGNLRRELRAAEAAVDTTLLGALDAEISRARRERSYFPFTERLPESAATVFESHRSRIESGRPSSIGEWMTEVSLGVDIESENDRSGIRIEF